MPRLIPVPVFPHDFSKTGLVLSSPLNEVVQQPVTLIVVPDDVVDIFACEFKAGIIGRFFRFKLYQLIG